IVRWRGTAVAKIRPDGGSLAIAPARRGWSWEACNQSAEEPRTAAAVRGPGPRWCVRGARALRTTLQTPLALHSHDLAAVGVDVQLDPVAVRIDRLHLIDPAAQHRLGDVVVVGVRQMADDPARRDHLAVAVPVVVVVVLVRTAVVVVLIPVLIVAI